MGGFSPGFAFLGFAVSSTPSDVTPADAELTPVDKSDAALTTVAVADDALTDVTVGDAEAVS